MSVNSKDTDVKTKLQNKITNFRHIFNTVKDLLIQDSNDDLRETFIQTCSLEKFLTDPAISKTILKAKEDELPTHFNELITTWVNGKMSEHDQKIGPRVGSVDLRGDLEKLCTPKSDAYPVMVREICGNTEGCDNDGKSDTEDSDESSEDEEKPQEDEGLEPTSYDLTQVEHDDEVLVSQEKTTREEFIKRYPNLPNVPCPKNLYVSTLGLRYLNSLYIVEADAFPRNWWELKKKDPKQAWHSLNQTIIPYTNKRWGNQGIDLSNAETAIDPYNINDLKQALVDAVKSANHNESSDPANKNSHHCEGETTLKETVITMMTGLSRIEDLLRILNSEAVKVSGRETMPRPPVVSPDPSISSVQTYKVNPTKDIRPNVYVYKEEEYL